MAIGINNNKLDDIRDDDEEKDDVREHDPSLFDGKKIAVIIGAIVVVMVLLLVVVPKLTNSEGSGQPTATVAPSATVGDGTGTTGDGTDATSDTGDGENTNVYTEGDTNYAKSDKNETTAKVYKPDEYIKDLTGKDISAVYTVKSRDYIKAHVSYKAKRAIIDDGMEMYWIDVVYKKKNYRVQVPFYYFKDFEDSGICRVEIEVLTLENGGQVISYMQVIPEEDDGDNSEG